MHFRTLGHICRGLQSKDTPTGHVQHYVASLPARAAHIPRLVGHVFHGRYDGRSYRDERGSMILLRYWGRRWNTRTDGRMLFCTPSNFPPRGPIEFHIRLDEMKHLKRLSVVSLAHECLGRQVLELAPSPRLESIEFGGRVVVRAFKHWRIC